MNVTHSYWGPEETVKLSNTISYHQLGLFYSQLQSFFFQILQENISFLSLHFVPDWLPVLFLSLYSDFFVPKVGTWWGQMYLIWNVKHSFKFSSKSKPELWHTTALVCELLLQRWLTAAQEERNVFSVFSKILSCPVMFKQNPIMLFKSF